MATIVVGILGRARAGKDTVASRLVTAHGFTRVAFADALKASALALDPWVDISGRISGTLAADYPRQAVRLSTAVAKFGWEGVKAAPDVRRLLQRLGTEAVREHVHPDAWVNALRRRVDAIPGPVVIPDVRYPNELAYVQNRGYSVRVLRPGHVDAATVGAGPHASETVLDDETTNFTIHNTGTVDAVMAAADRVALAIRRR